MKKVSLVMVLFLLLSSVCLADYWPPGTRVPNSAAARINDSGLVVISNMVKQMVTPAMVWDMLAPMNPLVDIQDQWWGSAVLNATGISFNTPISLTLDSQVNRMLFQAAITNIRLDFDIYLDTWLLDYDGPGYARINNLTMTAYPVVSINNGYIDIEFTNVQLDFTIDEIWIDDDLIGFLLDLLTGFISDIARTMLTDIITTTLEDQIEAIINDLPFDFSFEFMGVELLFSIRVQDVLMQADGITLWLSGEVASATTSDCVPTLPGSYYTPSDPPIYASTIPLSNPPEPYELGITINDDFINRALYTTFSSGLICLTLDPQFMEDLGLPFPVTSGLFAAAVPRMNLLGSNAPLTLVLKPKEPPVISYNANGSEYPISLYMHDLDMEIYMYTWDRWMHIFTLRIDIDDVQLGVEITEENMIHLLISEDLAVSNTVVWDEVLHLTQQERDNLETVLPTIVNIILPIVLDSIEDFPIPGFDQFSVDVKDIVVHGQRNYLGIFGDLIILPPTGAHAYQDEMLEETDYPLVLEAQ